MTFDVIAVGRISVDLYAREANASFLEHQTFAKSVGGSPTNVAVGAARLGLRSALVTRVGNDQLGGYARAKIAELGVITDFATILECSQTPVVLAALAPPEDPVIAFYRPVPAPDTCIEPSAVPIADIRSCRVLWISGGALASGATAATCFEWLEARGRKTHTVLDLDYRPGFWASKEHAGAAARQAMRSATVVVGNRAECEMAVGTAASHEAADRILELGVPCAIVKLGGDGVLMATADERVVVTPILIDVVCGLGAGDAFGAALTLGLVREWGLLKTAAFANAAGALVASRLLCADAMPTMDELETFIAMNGRNAG